MKSNKVNILGMLFDSVTMDQATEKAIDYLNYNKLHLIFTANPEIVMLGKENSEFLNIINSGNLIVADGIGVVIGSKILGNPLPERVAGYDLVQKVFEKIKDTNKSVYFFGAAPGVAKKAAKRMRVKYPGLNIVGIQDGYFTKEEEERILSNINELKPDILLVGLGAPKQENWLYKNKDKLNVKLAIGVGGSFDVMSGEIKRAPKLFIKLGLEWLYRLITQPSRIKRMIKLPIFLVEVFISKFKKV